MKEQMPEVRNLVAKEKKMTDEVVKKLGDAITAFKPQFKA
jgi:F-type H+-transporting ATPase subunit alpha